MSSEIAYDKRLVERMIKRGALTREEYERHLASLPDVASKSESLSIDTDDAHAESGKAKD
ncbi:MAG: hypothetical protein H6707_05845 [Deltaproteobacteria bacterium]|nr:hypothetical protein [Deltaproteobacteria bacterium]